MAVGLIRQYERDGGRQMCERWVQTIRGGFSGDLLTRLSISAPARFLWAVALVALMLLTETLLVSASPIRLQQSVSPNSLRPGRAHGVASQTVVELKRGETVKREIKGGEAHSFGLTLASGQYARLIIKWQGLDLDVALTKPDGKSLSEFGTQVRGPGPTPISILADQPGLYTIRVRPSETLAVTGSYELKLEDVRSPTAADESSLAARKALDEAQHQKSKETAISKHEESLQLWRKAEDLFGEADAFRSLANLYKAGGELKKAEDNYNQALGLWRKINDRQSEAFLLVDLGAAYQRLASPEKALGFYNQALRIFQEIKDSPGEALAHYSIGFAHALLGKTQDAIKFYEYALPIYQSVKDRLGEARTLNAAAAMYGRLGDSDKALELYQRVAVVRRELSDQLGEGVTTNNIGLIYDDWGDWQKARERYEQALTSYKSLLKKEWETCREASDKEVRACSAAASALDNIGMLYISLGDPQAAAEKFTESLSIRQSLKQPRGLGTTRARICYAAFLQSRYKDALDSCNQALSHNLEAKDYLGQADTLTVLGMIQSAQGQTQKALEYHEQALRLQNEAGDRRAQAITLDKMGSSYVAAGNIKNATETYNRALQLWRDVKDRDGEALTLGNLASAERSRGNLKEAHRYIEQATGIIESLRVNVTSQRLRTAYFASKVNLYELDIDLKMQLARTSGADNLVASALRVNEQARARSLLDTLAEDRIDNHRSADPKLGKLLESRLVIQRKLDAKARALTNLLNNKPPKEQVDAIANEINELTLEYDETEARIKTQNPRYASLTKPQILDPKEIQQSLLDDNTLLLEYALGTERSYLWVVSRTEIKGYELPKRAEIEESARRFKKLLTAGQKIAGEMPRQYEERLLKAEAQYRQEAATLGRLLLSPAALELGKKRLLIVAEGELQSIPFGALLKPANSASVEKTSPTSTIAAVNEAAPLIVEHEIIGLPSASTLALIRSDERARKPPPKTVAVLADPVFERDDSRLRLLNRGKGSIEALASRSQALTQALRDFGQSLPRLRSTRQEAQDIMAAAPAGTGMEALDFKANRATAVSPLLGQHRIVHFATHGILNDDYPELSGIVLSLYDERGRLQEDGFLRLHDIYRLNLPVDLVVLSACQTGLGKNIRGEGLIGLTRGFMYAGASRVVASLWKVDDEATAELMKRFYGYMLKGGMSPAAALREAQSSMREQKRWRAPFFWAGFVLQGEWK